VVDAIFATSLIVHSYIGFESCVIDYLHERKFPLLGVFAKWALKITTGLSIWGVYEFETNDIGQSVSFCCNLAVDTEGLTLDWILYRSHGACSSYVDGIEGMSGHYVLSFCISHLVSLILIQSEL
jgi:hypothetical protein